MYLLLNTPNCGDGTETLSGEIGKPSDLYSVRWFRHARGSVQFYMETVEVGMGEHKETLKFLVAPIAHHSFILGLNW